MHPLRRWLNRAGGVLLLILAILVLLAAFERATVDMYSDTPAVAHAGGRIGGRNYTNSIGAFSSAYQRGHRLIEVDFEMTADGVAVCGHDWSGFEGVPSLAAFSTARAKIDHPPCTIPELLDWLHQHPDAVLMSDAKSHVLEINKILHAALGERLLAQAYSVAEARSLQELGVRNLVLTLYRSGSRGERMAGVEELASSGIAVKALTMPILDALTGLALYAKTRLDVPIYTHTVNDCWSVFLVGAFGVDAVYTDDLIPGDCPLTPLS